MLLRTEVRRSNPRITIDTSRACGLKRASAASRDQVQEAVATA